MNPAFFVAIIIEIFGVYIHDLLKIDHFWANKKSVLLRFKLESNIFSKNRRSCRSNQKRNT